MRSGKLFTELYKVKREIQIHGDEYTVYKQKTDSYGETTSDIEEIQKVSGLFHITKGYTAQTISDGTKIKAKAQPMLMVCMEDSEQIENGMFVIINNNRYNIIDKNNIQEYNIVVDLSLELVQDGRN
nr:MAG TPA: hypothetical protein [Caudoviricetes sp.]